ncbi:MAG: BatD family protein [Puniceicoccales bacterium]|nr:BatD family protein [Puniceicoccales bacterium]
MKTRFFTIWIAFLQIFVANALPSSISINARFSPDKVDINDEVRYVVEITDAFPQSIKIPTVPGLRQRGESVFQSSTSVNGLVTQKTSFIFSFQAEKIGVIEMPEYNIEIDGEEYPVMPAKVKVVSDSNTTPQQQNQEISLEAKLSCSQAYVGQSIPVKLSIRINKLIQLQNPIKIQIANDAFSQSSLSKQPELKSDQGYKIYSWDTFITPLKSGPQEVIFRGTFPVQVARSMGFFAIAEQETVNLSSQPVPLKILPLPKAPADFSGGIGKFVLKNVRLSSDRALLEEPVTLSVAIEGEGNFSRLQAPKIPSYGSWNGSWKIFLPKTIFLPDDEYGFRGVKKIEFVIIPLKTGEVPVPDIALTFFNPQTGQFETVSIDNSQKTVLVSRSAETFSSSSADSSDERSTIDTPKTNNPPPPVRILANDTRPVKTLKPFYTQVWFWIMQACFTAIAALFALKTKALSAVPTEIKWNMKKIKALLVQALENKSAEQFYKGASEAIAQKLAALNVTGENRAEQIEQLREKNIKHLKWLESFLNEADAIAFGQGTTDPKYLQLQLERLIMFLQQKS